jgi:adenylate kinase family enzyme
VVVVGPCASGKSTLVRNLHKKGINAFVAGQEHSAIRNLWAKRDPDIIVALDVDLETLRKRRGETWPSNLYRVQHERLSDAFAAATTIIDTSRVSEEEAAAQVVEIVTNFSAS